MASTPPAAELPIFAIAALAPVLGPEALYTHDVSFTPPRSVARSTMVGFYLLCGDCGDG